MQLKDFNYELPEELIAMFPVPDRSASRLLCLDTATGKVEHHIFRELLDFLTPQDLLVFNDTRVIPARLFGHKSSGGAVEVFVERIHANNRLVCQLRANKVPKPGSEILFKRKIDETNQSAFAATVIEREGEFFVMQFSEALDLHAVLDEIGHVPLPPYIKRVDTGEDATRYQTVYANKPGAVAAPTAGLHFDESLLGAIADKGIECAYLTLHVGAGTFQPVRIDDVTKHKMHSEKIEISERVCAQVKACKLRGGRVIAVGTTSVRCLESATSDGELHPMQSETEIFIYPGYKFQIVDAMITNFHMPESTLLMLVSAFAGKEKILDAYHTAIENKYRFFSYGDAMLLY